MAVNKADAARALGVSRPRVSQYVKAGMPVRADGLIDLDAARAWCDSNLDPMKRQASEEARKKNRREARAVSGVPSADIGRASRELLALLPECMVYALAEAGLDRAIAERATKHTMEMIVDEMEDRVGTKLDVHAELGTWMMRVAWGSFFAQSGRSLCAGAIDLE